MKPVPPVYFRILKTQCGAISLINHPIRVQRFSKSHTHTTVKLDEEPHADLPSQYPNLEGRYQYKNTLNTAINISKRRKDLTIWSLIVLPSCSTIWIFYKAQTKTKIEISRKNQNQTQMTKKKVRRKRKERKKRINSLTTNKQTINQQNTRKVSRGEKKRN